MTDTSPNTAPVVDPSEIGREAGGEERVTAPSSEPGFVRRHLLLIPILAISALANAWGLRAVGWGNPYYSAAVRSMSTNLHSFFFASLDSSGFVSVDKAPFSLWLGVLSTKVFGYSQFAALLPSVVCGTLAVFFVYVGVHRSWGSVAARVAGLSLALTPVFAAINHSNNTDAVLVCVLTAAAMCAVEAVRSGRVRWLVAAAVFAGIGVTTKMLAALPVVPGLFLAFMWCAPLAWRKRLRSVVVAAVVFVVCGLWWFTAVQLTPKSLRPYVGSTQKNSMYELVFERNGVNQVDGTQALGGRGGAYGGRGGFGGFPGGFPSGPGVVPGPGGGGPGGGGPGVVPGPGGGGPGVVPGPGGGGPGGGFGLGFSGGNPGPWRLLNRDLGTQAGWLLPLAATAALSALMVTRVRPSARLGSLIVFGSWAAGAGTVFSITKGIVHPYYISQLGPPTAALVGIGVGTYREHVSKKGIRRIGALLLPIGLAGTAVVQWTLWRRFDWNRWFAPIAGAAIGVAAVVALVNVGRKVSVKKWPVTFAAIAPLIAPGFWLQGSLASGVSGNLPYAVPFSSLTGRGVGGGIVPNGGTQFATTDSAALVKFLRTHRTKEKWILGVQSAGIAEPIIITSGEPVMAMGGFIGNDPILTLDKLKKLVRDGDIRFFQLGDSSAFGAGFGGLLAGLAGRGLPGAQGQAATAAPASTQPANDASLGGLLPGSSDDPTVDETPSTSTTVPAVTPQLPQLPQLAQLREQLQPGMLRGTLAGGGLFGGTNDRTQWITDKCTKVPAEEYGQTATSNATTNGPAEQAGTRAFPGGPTAGIFSLYDCKGKA